MCITVLYEIMIISYFKFKIIYKIICKLYIIVYKVEYIYIYTHSTHTHIHMHTRRCPWLNVSTYKFSTLQWYECGMYSVETIVWSLNFNLFLDSWYTVQCDTLLWCWAQQWDTAPDQPHNQESKQPTHLQLFSSQTAVLFLPFRTVFNKLHDIFNTLEASQVAQW